jgi:hypothetical protein
MRDEWANRMAEQIRAGFRMQDMEKIANGLETLFVILEAMKLVRDTTNRNPRMTTLTGPGRRESPNTSITG